MIPSLFTKLDLERKRRRHRFVNPLTLYPQPVTRLRPTHVASAEVLLRYCDRGRFPLASDKPISMTLLFRGIRTGSTGSERELEYPHMLRTEKDPYGQG